MRISIIVFSIAFGFVAIGQNYNQPESVEYDIANNRYLISNRASGHKEIIARASNGDLSLFTSAVNSPAGLEILGNALYVADGGRVVGYDLDNSSEVFNHDLSGSFLNGITNDGNENLYVTDFSAKKIYRINVSENYFTEFVSNTVTTPNGIIYDGANSRLIFISWGSNAPIKAVNLADSVVSTITSTNLSNCDGIARDGAGNYYVSAWGTQSIHRFDSNFSNQPTQVVTGLSNPADIYYNTNSDTLAVPNSGNSTVTFHYFGNPTSFDESKIFDFNVFPNPVSKELKVNFSLPEKMKVNITLYDIGGKKIENLWDKHLDGGNNSLKFNVDMLTAGRYVIIFASENGNSLKKVILIN